MAKNFRILRSNMNSIFSNLAAEESLIASEMQNPTLYFWRNNPAVVIGRHQNPWKECNLSKLEDESISLSRRYSGGGAVYHDLGCSIFTFISPMSEASKSTEIIDSNLEIIIRAMRDLGLNVERKGRNDLMVGGMKISGSAFKQTPNVLVHHGTILVSTDMSKLGSLLTPSKFKLQSKGIDSVRARVANLSDLMPTIDHDIVVDAVSRQYRKSKLGILHPPPSSTDPEIIDDKIKDNPTFQHHHSTLRDWSWRYGSTPEFSYQIETRIDGIGCFDLHYQVNNGKVSKVRLFSDILYPEVIHEIEESLVGVDYNKQAIQDVLDKVESQQMAPERRHVVHEFIKWLLYELSDV